MVFIEQLSMTKEWVVVRFGKKNQIQFGRLRRNDFWVGMWATKNEE
jgi:hypothetical protein